MEKRLNFHPVPVLGLSAAATVQHMQEHIFTASAPAAGSIVRWPEAAILGSIGRGEK